MVLKTEGSFNWAL